MASLNHLRARHISGDFRPGIQMSIFTGTNSEATNLRGIPIGTRGVAVNCVSGRESRARARERKRRRESLLVTPHYFPTGWRGRGVTTNTGEVFLATRCVARGQSSLRSGARTLNIAVILFITDRETRRGSPVNFYRAARQAIRNASGEKAIAIEIFVLAVSYM